MPRNNVRKTSIGLVSAEDMKQALKLIEEDKLSIRTASKRKNIIYTTLYRYHQKAIRAAGQNIRLTPNYKVNQIFTMDQEITLVDYIIKYCQMFYGLTPIEVRSLAYEMAVKNGNKVPKKWHTHKMAGIEWLYGFRKRHGNLSLRMPEGCSLSRATSFNRHNVKLFYDNLAEVMSRNPRFGDGTRVFNLDETNTMTVQACGRILAPRGQKQVSKVTSAEKGTLVSTCYIVCATGYALPPVMVFPRVYFKNHMTKDAPAGTLGLATQSGWMNTDLFLPTMQHFIDQTQSSKDNPSLLIMDNYEAHISLKALNLAKDNSVTILTVPPHSTGKLQPLDVAIFGPFKKAYNRAVDSWMMRNPGHTFSIYDVAGCVKEAHMAAMIPSNICSGFAATGIFPFNRDVFTDVDFAPSEVTNRPLTEENPRQTPPTRSPTRFPSPSIIQEPNLLEDAWPLQGDFQREHEHENTRLLLTPPIVSEQQHTPPLLKSTSATMREERDLPGTSGIQTILPHSSTTIVSPFEFRGLPTAGPRKNNRAPRRKGKSMIATDTPNKDEIEKRDIEKTEKKRKEIAKKIKKKIMQSDDSNDDEAGKISVYSEEEGCFDDEDEDVESDQNIEPKNFVSLSKAPAEGSFVLVEFQAQHNKKVFYVGKVLNENAGKDVEITFLRKSQKTENTFRLPNVPDIGTVPLYDIKLVLPTPSYSGQTKRQQGIYTFDKSFAHIDIR